MSANQQTYTVSMHQKCSMPSNRNGKRVFDSRTGKLLDERFPTVEEYLKSKEKYLGYQLIFNPLSEKLEVIQKSGRLAVEERPPTVKEYLENEQSHSEYQLMFNPLTGKLEVVAKSDR